MVLFTRDDIVFLGEGNNMSTAPRPPLRLSATCLGPVAKLDATLSKNAQNLIYARNGTGKSFLTRALRYLDLQAQGQDVSDAAFNLVSEESNDSQGSFSLIQGTTNLATLSLNHRANQVLANTHDRIFHVFSDDFVHSDLRQRNYDMDGNIESEIRLDQTNIDTKNVEERLRLKQREFGKARIVLQNVLDAQRVEELANKAAVSKRLKEYMDVSLERVLSSAAQPPPPPRSVKDILSDLDALKAIPAEPAYPDAVEALNIKAERLTQMDDLLRKITSPSTISEEIKTLISARPDFFEAGLDALKDGCAESCPFCRQSIAHPPVKDRIQLYIAYFADAEGRHKKELRVAWTDIKAIRNALNARVTSAAHETLKFDALRKFVPSQRNVELPDLTSSAQAVDKVLGEYLGSIEAKGHSPGVEVTIPSGGIEGLLSQLNRDIEALNAIFSNITAAVKSSDTERKALQRAVCLAFEAEFVHANWASIAAIHDLGKEVDNIEKELDALKKSQLSASVKERVAQTFESLIGGFFGEKYSFDRAEFILNRENKKMARGASRTLSDGEKTAIAFCYFIACAHKKVKSTSDYARLFLVFDDPITSMSYDFVFSIAQTLKNMSITSDGEISINPADIAKSSRPELLVFTHSSYFYNICVTNNVVKDDAAFFLRQVGGEHKLSNRARYITPFEQHLKEIVDVSGGRDPDHTTGNAVRCVLEAIGRFAARINATPSQTSLSSSRAKAGFRLRAYSSIICPTAPTTTRPPVPKNFVKRAARPSLS